MKIAVIAAAALFIGFAASASAAPATDQTRAPAAQNQQMQDVSSQHRRWHRRWDRHHRVCRTYWHHGRRHTVCR